MKFLLAAILSVLLLAATPAVFGSSYISTHLPAGSICASAMERDGTFRMAYFMPPVGGGALRHRAMGAMPSDTMVSTFPGTPPQAVLLQIDRLGRSHVVFSMASGIVHRYSEQGAWFGGTVANLLPGGAPLLAMDLDRTVEESRPMVVYSPQSSEDRGLWLAERSDVGWTSQRIVPSTAGEPPSQTAPVWRHAHPSLAVDREGNPHVAYLAEFAPGVLQLRYAWRKGGVWREVSVWTQGGVPLNIDEEYLPKRFRLVSLVLPDGHTPHLLAFLPEGFANGHVRGNIRLFRPHGGPGEPWQSLQVGTEIHAANDLGMVAAADVHRPLALAFTTWNSLTQSSTVWIFSAAVQPLSVELADAFTVPGPVHHLQALWAQGSPFAEVLYHNLQAGGNPHRVLRRPTSYAFPTDGFPQHRSLTAAVNAALGRNLSTPVSDEDLRGVTNLALSDSRISDLSRLAEALNLQNLSAARARILDLAPLLEAPALQWVDVSSNGLEQRWGARAADQVAALRERGVFVQWSHPWHPWRWVADPLLEDILRRQAFGPGPARWQQAFSSSHAAALQTLDATGRGIFSLEGLEAAENLRVLLADDNHLRDLEPLRGLQELREVHFSNRGSRPFFGGNKIRDLSPLAGAEHLQMAAGEFNEVTDLFPLRGAFRQGGFLNLRGNGLETEGGSATARLIEEWRTQSNPVFVDDQAQRSPWNWELDPALEAVLRQQLGLASGQDFLPWYHQWVTVLLAPEAGIRSLRGLERARQLQRLEAPNNAIRCLEPLRGLPLLSELDVRGNLLTDLSPLREWALPDGILQLAGNGLDFSPGGRAGEICHELEEQGVQVWREEHTQRNPWNWMLDPGLERAIRRDLSLPPPQEFSWEHATLLVSLQAAGEGIRSLEGLELARSLVFLDLSRNRIESLAPLAGLRRLQTLLLGNGGHGVPGLNRVADLTPLSGLRQLQMLDLRGNRVTDLEPLVTTLREGAFLQLEMNGLVGEREDPVLADQLRELESRGIFVQVGTQRSPWNWTLEPSLARRVGLAVGLPPGEPFTENSHHQLTELDLGSSGVRSLAGLRHTPNLQRLTLPTEYEGYVPRLASGTGPAVWQTDSSRQQELQSGAAAARLQGMAEGREAVLQNPNAEGLFRRQQIFDARFGAKTMEVQDGKFRVRWSVEGSEDLQQWEEVEAFETEVILPEKIFLRLAPRDSLSDP